MGVVVVHVKTNVPLGRIGMTRDIGVLTIGSRTNLVDGGEFEVFVVRELLVSRPHEGLERDALVGLDIFDEAL